MSPLIAAAALILLPPAGEIAAAESPTASGGATLLAEWRFGADEDLDFDRWPDGWLRRRGAAFPHFVPVEIDPNGIPNRPDGPGDAAALWMAVNGGAAAAYASPVPVSGRPALRLSGRLRTEALDGCATVMSLSLLDVHRVRLARFLSQPVSGTSPSGGQAVAIGPAAPVPGAVWAVVGCHLVPGSGVSVGGAAWFDDVELSAEPFLSLERTAGGPVVGPDETVTLQLTLSGAPTDGPIPALSVAVRNADDGTVFQPPTLLNPVRIGSEVTAQPVVGPLPIGLWEVSAATEAGATVRTRTLRVAVADPADLLHGVGVEPGRFGLALFAAPDSPADAVAEAAASAGAGWIRWTAGDPAADERLAAAVRSRHLRPMVQLTAENFGRPGSATADALAALPDPMGTIERLARPLAVHVRHWQMGVDAEPLSMRRQLKPSPAGLLRAAAPGVMVVGPPDAGSDRSILVGAVPGPASAWRVVSATGEPSEFLWRLVETCAAGTGPVFAAGAFNDAGLIADDGSPTRRFLPFRTAAALLRDSELLGPIRFPDLPRREEPQALAFRTPAGPVVVVRGAEDGRAILYLGGTPVARDEIGRTGALPEEQARHRVTWSERPLFLTGMDERLLRLRLDTTLEDDGLLQSSPDPQPLRVRIKNVGADVTTFTVAVEVPDDWTLLPTQTELTVPADGEGVAEFTVVQPPDVSLGEHPVTVRLTPSDHGGVILRIPRTVAVQLAGLRLNVTDRPLPDGGWEVTQTLINELPDGSAPAFRCDVQIPGAARVSHETEPLELGAHRHTHRLPDAEAGDEVWLRCTELNGNRVLNRRWTLGDPPPPSPTNPPRTLPTGGLQ